MSASGGDRPWYAEGLGFACTRCGNCCSGSPGHVWVSPAECERIAVQLNLSLEDCTRRYVRRVGLRLSLREQRGGDCVFLVRGAGGVTSCVIHPVRPTQCRTWPFWASNLNTPEAWNKAARGCPGMNVGGRHPLPVIQAALHENGDLPL